MGGAAAIGLLTGFATGASKKAGSTGEFVTMVGTGILVPILAGLSEFLGKTQKTTEYSTYLESHLVEKTTTIVNQPSSGSISTMAALGSFFLAFSLLAVIGLIGGSLLRKGESVELPFK